MREQLLLVSSVIDETPPYDGRKIYTAVSLQIRYDELTLTGRE